MKLLGKLRLRQRFVGEGGGSGCRQSSLSTQNGARAGFELLQPGARFRQSCKGGFVPGFVVLVLGVASAVGVQQAVLRFDSAIAFVAFDFGQSSFAGILSRRRNPCLPGFER